MKIFCKFAGMKKFLILALMLGCVTAAAQTPQEEYVQKYSAWAVEEMGRSGVPASITLAQGILESGAGMSRLASEGNNHFGIKCHKGWTGKSMKVDDDAPNECFRVYSSARESFQDHSDFLRYRDRYKFLFDLDPTDYKGWAYGLSKAGYATDPLYPAKLIKYIEEYDLARFDTGEAAYVPPSPLAIEEPVAVDMSIPSGSEHISFSVSREMYSKNGVPFIYSQEGETYASIAHENKLFLREILHFNDVTKDRGLEPGTIVYLQAKKTKTQKGLDKYIVEEDGEDFHAICQRFAVKEKVILKKNGFREPVLLSEGDEIKLR